MKSKLTLVVLCASALLTGAACNSQFIRGEQNAELTPNTGATNDIDNPNSTGTTLELGSAYSGTAPVNAGARANFNPQMIAKKAVVAAPVVVAAVPAVVETPKAAPAVAPIAKPAKVLPRKHSAIAAATTTAPKKVAHVAKKHRRHHRAVAATGVATKKSAQTVTAHKTAKAKAGALISGSKTHKTMIGKKALTPAEATKPTVIVAPVVVEPVVVAPVVRTTTVSGVTTSATTGNGSDLDYLDRNGYRNRANKTGTQWADPVYPTTEELLKQND